ncbi:MAG: ribonuclease P protein component [Dermatophilaceae bacterium]
MLPARHRLRTRAEFAAAVRSRRCGGPLLIVHCSVPDDPGRPSREASPPRVGFVVSKAVGNAVVRNRTKRRLRALMAQRMVAVPDGTDVVVRARPVAADASHEVLARELDRCLNRCLRSLR